MPLSPSTISKTSALLTAALAVVCCLSPLAFRNLLVPDEYRYAEIAREMLAGGDWVTPRQAGLRYFEKPPLAAWLGGLAMAAFGPNPFAARLPSALSALLLALALTALFRRMGGEKAAADTAGLIFLSSALPGALAQTNLVDLPLACCLTLSLAAFYFADTEKRPSRRMLFLLLAGAAAGGAFLAKGFLAFVIPALVVFPFLLWEKRGWDFFSHLPPIILAALAAILPWAILIHRAESTFWDYFIITEHIQRFLGASFAQHTEPFWFFLPVLAWGLIPWLFLLPAAWPSWSSSRPFRFLACWVVFPFLFFSLSEGKLATYILPCLPAGALLLARGLNRSLAEGRSGWFDAAARALAALILLLSLAFLVFQFARPYDAPYVRGEEGKLAIAVAGLLAWAFLSFRSAEAKSPPVKIRLFASGALIALAVVGLAIPRRVQEYRSPGRLLERNRDRLLPSSTIFTTVETAAAAAWHLRRSDERLLIVDDEGELAFGLSFPEARSRYLDWAAFGRAVAALDPSLPAAVIVPKDFYLGNVPRFPLYDYRDEISGFVLLWFSPRTDNQPETDQAQTRDRAVP
jgi:4-amino-4-deoxy-L-arabinose transferase